MIAIDSADAVVSDPAPKNEPAAYAASSSFRPYSRNIKEGKLGSAGLKKSRPTDLMLEEVPPKAIYPRPTLHAVSHCVKLLSEQGKLNAMSFFSITPSLAGEVAQNRVRVEELSENHRSTEPMTALVDGSHILWSKVSADVSIICLGLPSSYRVGVVLP